MKIVDCEVAVVGGGPAGMAAAVSAAQQGAQVIIIERNSMLGGILNQCIHDGFGLIHFREPLTGPEYADRYEQKVLNSTKILCLTDALVNKITSERQIFCTTREGILQINAISIVLATGCRERTRGAISIPGTRVSGIYTAGVAQELINLHNIAIGKKAVILGSGDIGLIMARRLTLEGVEVVCILEKLPYCSGLPRNVSQCLTDFNIPLHLSRTIIDVRGDRRLDSVLTAQLDGDGRIISGSEEVIFCDTLILSVGLIPENEAVRTAGVVLSPITGGAEINSHMETAVPGIFACGNALHVNDLVDNVSEEGTLAGKWAAKFVDMADEHERIRIFVGDGLRYVVPQFLIPEESTTLSMRVDSPGCGKKISVRANREIIFEKEYARVSPAEMIRIKLPRIGEGTRNLEVFLR